MSRYRVLNATEWASSENNRQPKKNNCDRHQRRAGDISQQDEEDRDDGKDGCDVVLHNFSLVSLPRLWRELVCSKVPEQIDFEFWK